MTTVREPATATVWSLGGIEFHSRLLVGSARYPSRNQLLASIEATHAEIVTVSIRRVDVRGGDGNLYEALTERGLRLLPNTAGCFTARDAVMTAQLAREALHTDWIKLEGDCRRRDPAAGYGRTSCRDAHPDRRWLYGLAIHQ